MVTEVNSLHNGHTNVCTWQLMYTQFPMARPSSAPKERVWDMATEQFVTPHCGVRTNHSTVFSHMIPDVLNGKIQNWNSSRAQTWSVISVLNKKCL